MKYVSGKEGISGILISDMYLFNNFFPVHPSMETFCRVLGDSRWPAGLGGSAMCLGGLDPVIRDHTSSTIPSFKVIPM